MTSIGRDGKGVARLSADVRQTWTIRDRPSVHWTGPTSVCHLIRVLYGGSREPS